MRPILCHTTMRHLATTIAAVWLAGCAQTTVQTLSETSAVDLPRPPVVLVLPFAVNVDEVTNQSVLRHAVDAVENQNATERSEQVARDVADAVADGLVSRITAMGLPARRATRDTQAPRHAVIVGGRFVDIDEGNRLRRLVIGFGAGQSRIDAQVDVLQATGRGYRHLVEFDTHADSGRMPGAAVTMGAGAAARAVSPWAWLPPTPR